MIENIRLGYACLNTDLNTSFKTCIQRTYTQEKSINLGKENLRTILKTLKWNTDNKIFLYRMPSCIFPHITNPVFLKNNKNYVYDIQIFKSLCEKIGRYAKKHGHRITFHPDQFNQIASPNKNVFEKTTRELQLHADILDMMQCDQDSVIVVHGGGVYKDKKQTMKRWVERFFLLPENVQKRLVIENCERAYSPLDMLWLSKRTGCPVVFDTHHYNCYLQKEKLPHPSKFLKKIIKTWEKRGIKPKFHISDQDPSKRLGAHHDYVQEIPDYLFIDTPIDLMVEAKMKEQAVFFLINQYDW